MLKGGVNLRGEGMLVGGEKLKGRTTAMDDDEIQERVGVDLEL